MFKLFKKKTKEVLSSSEKNNVISNNIKNNSVSELYINHIYTQYDLMNIIKF